MTATPANQPHVLVMLDLSCALVKVFLLPYNAYSMCLILNC